MIWNDIYDKQTAKITTLKLCKNRMMLILSYLNEPTDCKNTDSDVVHDSFGLSSRNYR